VTTVRRRIPVIDRLPSQAAARSPAWYVRQARALRGRLRRNPAKLHRALRDLNAEQPAPSPLPESPPASAEQTFYAAAEAAFDGATLRYSQRLSLLDLAHALAIPRFRANLMIATVQHARQSAAGAAPARSWAWPISLGILLQATILFSIALLLRP
jgi:hypothetical protein